ncbi:MAG: hypothetical protein QOD57_2722, partial [Actinomycetota bacterium]|nr:hypothetical protein [Actinomycetota bacterium]
RVQEPADRDEQYASLVADLRRAAALDPTTIDTATINEENR